MEGFVPKMQFRDRWLTVLVCEKCQAVAAVIKDEPPVLGMKGTNSWKCLDGDDRAPCPSCGHYQLLTSFDLKGGEKGEKTTTFLIVHHLDRAVARYIDPTLWWNPFTWSLEGEWEVKKDDPPAKPPLPKTPSPIPEA